MVSTEEILITMLGKDEVTPVVNNIQGNVNSSFSNMSQSASQSASSIGQAYTSTFDQISRGLSALNTGMMGINSVSSMMLRELGGSKSASQYVYGTSAVAETNKVLMKSWADAKVSYEDLYNTVDKVTDNSLTSMQELVPAMNAFKASTGATGTQLRDDVTESMAQFGAYVKALTGSEQLAKTAMTDLSKGLVGKGSFNALDQYGVTRASLEARGWSGKNEDIKGYMEAVRDVAGQVDELMKTPEGASARLGKMWSRAGKRIGQEALPFVVNLKNAFMDLDDELGGELSTNILRVSLYIEEAQQKLYMFNTLWTGIKNIGEAFRTVGSVLGIFNTAQDANNIAQEENNRLLEESNLKLAENNQLRLANAEAMGLQNTQSSGYDTGVMPYSDAIGYTSEMESESGWGSDVLANTAGGLLEDRYNKALYGIGDEGASMSNNYYEQFFGDIHPNDTVVGKTSFLSADYYTDLFISEYKKEQEKNNALVKKLFDNPYFEDVGEPNKIIFPHTFDNTTLDEIKDAMGERESAIKTVQNSMSVLEDSRNKINSGELGNLGHYGADYVNKLDMNLGMGQNFLKEFAPETVDTDDLEEKTAGPFRRLHSFFTKKEKRDVTLFDDMVKSDRRSRAKARLSFKEFKDSFRSIKTNITDLKGETKIDTMDNVWDGLRNAFTGLRGGGAVMDEVATEMGETAVSTGVVATESQAVGKESLVASEGMVEAETGLTFMGLAEMGLVGAFTTLIVPTLAIAGVIAILIPIIAGLVIEALYFINLVGQFMESMDFNFNLSGVADNFQELGTALAWLGVAMASMSFAGIMTGLAYIFTGFGNVKAVLGQAMGMLSDVVVVLNSSLNTAQVNPNVATNLETLGSTINNVTLAMASLVGTALVSRIGDIVTSFGLFGTLSDTFRKAGNDLQEAVNVINQMDFTGIDETKVTTIKTTLEAIGAFADAFTGLNDIRNTDAIGGFTSWLLNGGLLGGQGDTIEQAFKSAKKDIEKASKALSQFDGSKIKAPKQETVDKLKLVGDAIKSVADSINSLRELRDAYNWDDWVGGIFGGKDIGTVFKQVKKDLVKISGYLKSLGTDKNLSKVPDDLSDKIKKVSDGISAVSNAVTTAQNVPKVSSEEIGNRIRQATKSVKLMINSFKGFNVKNAPTEEILTGITNASKGVSKLGKAIFNALAIPDSNPETIEAKVKNGVSSVKKIITQLNRLKGQSVSADVGNALKSINTALTNLKNTLNSTSFNAQGKHIGSTLKNGIATGMNGTSTKIKNQLTNAVNHSGAYALGKKMGNKVTQGFKAGLNLLDAVMSKLSEIDLSTIVSDFVTGGLEGETENPNGDNHGGGSLDMGMDSVLRYRMLNNTAKTTASRVDSISTMGGKSTLGNTNKNVSINIGEGAIQLDARNMTTKESRQIMINALEGLSMVSNVDVNGA